MDYIFNASIFDTPTLYSPSLYLLLYTRNLSFYSYSIFFCGLYITLSIVHFLFPLGFYIILPRTFLLLLTLDCICISLAPTLYFPLAFILYSTELLFLASNLHTPFLMAALTFFSPWILYYTWHFSFLDSFTCVTYFYNIDIVHILYPSI
jgi:hypothetical protein